MPSWEVWEEVGFRSLSSQWKQFAAVPSGLYLAANSGCSAVDWCWCNKGRMTRASFLLHWYLYQVFIQWDETSNTFYYDKQHFKGHKSCFNWHFLLSVVLQVFLKPPFFCGTSTVAQQEVIAVLRNIFPSNDSEKSWNIQNSQLVSHESYLHLVLELFKENIWGESNETTTLTHTIKFLWKKGEGMHTWFSPLNRSIQLLVISNLSRAWWTE